MGRIKTALIKRITFKLLDNHEDKFGVDYEKNKQSVSETTNISSKKLRNIIAGYISRIVKSRN
jgi:small subunit ribosomal protein S17e